MRNSSWIGLALAVSANLCYAYLPQPQITDDKVSVTAPNGEVSVGSNKLEICYSYLLLGERNLKISYAIAGTNCNDEISLQGKSGVAVRDAILVNCELTKAGVYTTSASICSFDGEVQKSCSTDEGQLTVRTVY